MIVKQRTWSGQQDAIYGWFTNSLVDGVRYQNLVVVARAGTGKTTTIIEGISRASDKQILLAAFSKQDATELQARIKTSGVEAKTLHALGFKFLARYSGWGKLDVDDNRARNLTKLADPEVPDALLRTISELHSKGREIYPMIAVNGRPSDLIDLAIKFNLVPDDDWEDKGWDLDKCCVVAHKAMKLAMVKTAKIDYADMIFLPLVLNFVRPWYDMVVVDEAQDMTEAQLTLAQRSCRRNGRICIVGDDRQAIYGFRGADSGSLSRLKLQLKAAQLGLTTTYRCGSSIVALAQQYVPDYTAAPNAHAGQILNIDMDAMLDKAKAGDFVISRTNAPLIRVCMSLLKRGVRAKVRGRDIGKGIIALIRKFKAPSLSALLPALADWHMNECAKAMDKLSEQAAEERAQYVTDQKLVIEALADGCKTISDLEGKCIDLFVDDANNAVMCSTVHRAKGREADATFLLEGTFFKGKEEEDNIKYVAITRAKNTLHWVKGFDKMATPIDGLVQVPNLSLLPMGEVAQGIADIAANLASA